MFSIQISGTGSYLPQHEISNADLVRAIGQKTPAWIERRLDIIKRRFSSPINYATGRLINQDVDEIEMARKAAENAMISAKLAPEEIDGL